MPEKNAADMLYDKTPSPQPPPAHTRLIGLGPNPAATDPAASDGLSKFYAPETALRDAFHEQRDTAADVLGLTQAQAQQREREFLQGVIVGPGLDPHTVGKLLLELKTAADVADARGEEVDEAQVVQWGEAARRAVRQQYAGHGWDIDDLLSRTRKFVASHPALQALLLRHGIGSRKEVVEALVEHVRVNNIGR